MAQKASSPSHTEWLCKYHIVFTPKYRRNEATIAKHGREQERADIAQDRPGVKEYEDPGM